MSNFPHTGSCGPTVGPDGDGIAGPAWVVTAAGHTVRGWPWFVVRKRGGRMVRITVAPWQATPAAIIEIITARVASLTTITRDTY